MEGRGYRVLSMLEPVERALDELERVAEVEVGTSLGRGAVLERLGDFDGVLADDEFRYDGEFFASSEELRVVSRVGVGYENVDVGAATEHGVMVTNTPGVMAESVAEHAIMLMLAGAKNLALADREVRQGSWEWEKYRGMELWNRTLGQVGLGKIGYQVARKAAGCFNMRVLVYDPYAPEERALEAGGKKVEFEEVLQQADVVSVNVPLTEETQHLFSEEQFLAMKESAILVNTSRGAVVDQSALVRALESGWISRAALDVLEEEPPPEDEPLFELDDVVITPHQASNTHTGVNNMFMESTRNLIAALEGKKPSFLINESVYRD